MMKCPECKEDIFFTGEFHPTLIPIRFYACANKHIMKITEDGIPDWGDFSITKAWQNAIRSKTSDDWKLIQWK